MTAPSARPAIALILLSYRQEAFIAQALRSALDQDCEGLEIVVSDDCSPDGSWQAIEREAARYQGPHRLILNRNLRNLGLMGNLATAMRLSSAPYLVLAAGDDISEPYRVKEIAERFAADPQTKFVTSTFRLLYLDGKLGEGLTPWPGQLPITAQALADIPTSYVQGCVNAYSRDVFDMFGDFIPQLAVEDQALPFRALLLGNAAYISHPLVHYRINPNGYTETWRSLDDPMAGFKMIANTVGGFRQKIADIDHLISRGIGDRDTLLGLRQKCARSLAALERELAWQVPGWRGVFHLIGGVFVRAIGAKDAVKVLLRVNFSRFWAWYVRRRHRSAQP